MSTLRSRLEAAEERAFQGRSAELDRVAALLDDPGRLPRLVSVYGPPGIGKTAFAMALARRCERAGSATPVAIDSRDFAHDVADLSRAVAGRSPWPPAPGCRPVLLTLDTYEEMADFEAEFRDRFVAALSGPVLVLLVGRRRASGFLDEPAWRAFAEEIELGRLPRAESLEIARQRGLIDETALEHVLAFARGNPLVLGMAADLLVADPAADLRDQGGSPAAAHRLVARMTRDVHDPWLRGLLEAACVVRTFNEELLSAMLGRDTSGAFPELCGLSVVRLTEAGARVHDIVRRSVAADLRWRAPLRYRELRERAYRHLKRAVSRNRAAPALVEELAFLAGEANPTASFFAPTEQQLEVRTIRPQELPLLLDLCRVGVTNFGTSPERRLLEVANDVTAAPDWFLLALDGDRPVGFGYTFPLHEQSLAVAAAIRGPFFDRLPASELEEIRSAPATSPAAFLITGSTYLPSHPQAEAALRSAAFAKRNSHAPSAPRSYVLLAQGDAFQCRATSMGMRRRGASIPLPPAGELVDEWLLDYGEWGLTSWVEAALGIEAPLTRRPASFAERTPQVKAAFERLYSEQLAESPLTELRAVRGRSDDAAQDLRAVLIATVGELEASGSRRDREAAAVLRAYYVRQVGTHDTVAERLGLARTTFYRRLRLGLELVARRLIVEEVGGVETP